MCRVEFRGVFLLPARELALPGPLRQINALVQTGEIIQDKQRLMTLSTLLRHIDNLPPQCNGELLDKRVLDRLHVRADLTETLLQ